MAQPQDDQITAMLQAVRAGDSRTVAQLIASGVDVNADVRCVSMFDRTKFLHVAAKFGHLDILQQLLSAGADVNSREHVAIALVTLPPGSTPIMTAAVNGHVDALKCLIDAGADIRAVSGRGTTILHYAAGSVRNQVPYSKYVEMLDLLFNRVDWQLTPEQYESILVQADMPRGDLSGFCYLADKMPSSVLALAFPRRISKGAVNATIQQIIADPALKPYRQTKREIACDRLKFQQLLLDASIILKRHKGIATGQAPCMAAESLNVSGVLLFRAAAAGDRSEVLRLLRAGADPLTTTRGRSVLFAALKANSTPILEVVLSALWNLNDMDFGRMAFEALDGMRAFKLNEAVTMLILELSERCGSEWAADAMLKHAQPGMIWAAIMGRHKAEVQPQALQVHREAIAKQQSELQQLIVSTVMLLKQL